MAVGVGAGDLRELTDEELITKLRESKEELFNLRFQTATGQLTTTIGCAPSVRRSRAPTRCFGNVSWVWLPGPTVRIRKW